MYFETAPITQETLIFTLFLSGILLILGVIPGFVGHRVLKTKLTLVLNIFNLVFFPGLIILCVASVPQKYLVDSEKIVINRLINDVHIDLEDIVEIKFLTPTEMKLIGKNGWNPGVMGFVGKYTSEGLGMFSAYVTNWKYSLLIELQNDMSVVISPDKPEKFISLVNNVRN